MISPQIEGDSLILASGFFQEDPEKDYSILDDRLLDALLSNEIITDILAVGAMRSPAPFNEFCKKLDENWEGTLTTNRKSNWHAKIAMKLKSRLVDTDKIEKIPVCAIIGSSNLTRPAYGIAGDIPENVTSRLNFNYECDVVIFAKDWFGNITKAPPKFFPGFDRQDFGSIYFQDLPYGCPDEIDQMKMLLKEIEGHIRK
jgi:hypothetical protein